MIATATAKATATSNGNAREWAGPVRCAAEPRPYDVVKICDDGFRTWARQAPRLRNLSAPLRHELLGAEADYWVYLHGAAGWEPAGG